MKQRSFHYLLQRLGDYDDETDADGDVERAAEADALCHCHELSM